MHRLYLAARREHGGIECGPDRAGREQRVTHGLIHSSVMSVEKLEPPGGFGDRNGLL